MKSQHVTEKQSTVEFIFSVDFFSFMKDDNELNNKLKITDG